MLSETIQTTGYNDSNYLERLERYMNKKNDLPEWISTSEAAEIMDIHIESVRRLCRKGTITCKQFGHFWMVLSADALKYDKDKMVGGRGKEGEL